jgi:hypothetical protein
MRRHSDNRIDERIRSMKRELISLWRRFMQERIASRANLSFHTRYLLAACAIGMPARAQAVGTDFCLPGQSGVIACPCNNPPTGGGKGCDKYGPGSVGVSASLIATGNPSVTSGMDTLQLQVVSENDTVLTIFAQATTSGAAGVTYGAAVNCLTGTPKVLYNGHAGSGEPMGQITRPRTGTDPEVHVRSAAMGDPISSGQTRYYMAAYRDKNAASAANCNNAALTFNATQGIAIVWGP